MIDMNQLRFDSIGLALHVTLGAALMGCLDPTQAIVDISTDSPCAYGVDTGISAGLLTDIEAPIYDTRTSTCKEGGEIGSIVLVPPEDADKDAPFALKVVASLGEPLESCVAPEYGPHCIVARRAMRFVPQRPFHVPVHLSLACAGVICPESQTCVDGTCRNAIVDPNDCIGAGTCEPDPVDVPAWQLPIGGSGLHMARDVEVGADGAVVLAGLFDSSVQIGDETYVSKGGTDVFMAAYSPTGAVKWSRSFGGPRFDEVYRVTIGSDGSIVMLFQFEESLDVGGGPMSSVGKTTDVAIAKFTAYGKLEWAIPMGGLGAEYASSVTTDRFGNIYITGTYDKPFTVQGQTVPSYGATDTFVLSFTRTGELRWAKGMGSSGSESAGSIVAGTKNDVYVAGQFGGKMDLNGATSVTPVGGGTDAFLARYDSSGEFQWIRTLTSEGSDDRLMEAAVQGDRVVVTGKISKTGTLGEMPVDTKGGEGLVASFDTSGTIQWVRLFAASGVGQDIAIAADGAIVIGGNTNSSAVFGSKPITAPGYSNAFVAVLESDDGTPRWAKMFRSSQYSYTVSVAAAQNDFVYAAGWYANDFDNGVDVWTGPSLFDVEGFLLRIAPP